MKSSMMWEVFRLRKSRPKSYKHDHNQLAATWKIYDKTFVGRVLENKHQDFLEVKTFIF